MHSFEFFFFCLEGAEVIQDVPGTQETDFS